MDAPPREEREEVYDDYTRFADGLWNVAAESSNRDRHPMFSMGDALREFCEARISLAVAAHRAILARSGRPADA